MKKYSELYEEYVYSLLCIHEPDKYWYWQFTYGKTYKVYKSPMHGLRVKDDNGHYSNLDNRASLYHETFVNGKTFYEYMNCILANFRSIEEYEKWKSFQKFGL